MAGAKSGNFRELISPFLKDKIREAEQSGDQASVNALLMQYRRDSREDDITELERRRHYESELSIEFEGEPLVGVERLYRRTILIEPTTVCAAHCRWCLRGQYPVKTMYKDDIARAARYVGSAAVRDDIREVLITGGDPLMSRPLLAHTIEQLVSHAENIRIVRIGSRVPFQDPQRINEEMIAVFNRYPQLRFEVGVNVNHPVEFWPESTEALKRLRDAGVRLYNQNPLLKGVNDNKQVLFDLFGALRDHDIEAHYLFHAIPMRGMRHHRTTVEEGLRLATLISSSGEFSGRSKPRYALLSDIGKIVLFHDSIVARRDEDNAILVRSGFSLNERLKWNPAWTMPRETVIDNEGLMMTWYQDVEPETSRSVLKAVS
ncbi:MAG: radical SAM protein [Pseudomonadota bacterium]